MTIIGGLGVPKRNRAYEHGIAMDSRLIFRPFTCICDGMTEKIILSMLMDSCLWFPDLSASKMRQTAFNGDFGF